MISSVDLSEQMYAWGMNKIEAGVSMNTVLDFMGLPHNIDKEGDAGNVEYILNTWTGLCNKYISEYLDDQHYEKLVKHQKIQRIKKEAFSNLLNDFKEQMKLTSTKQLTLRKSLRGYHGVSMRF
tara:strand:+ start:5389 stop:5760 length:372 start_codon:yes stop_codon:yes gene_type:complete